MSRRRLIAAGIAVPGLVVLERAASMAGDALSGATRAARPTPAGTSATRCAQCGSADHTMLDPGCPLAPRVLT
jgi:hypothetical protein